MDNRRITHPIPPLFDDKSRILILGSFPSVKSREAQFFYHHPQNRFWAVVAAVFCTMAPAARGGSSMAPAAPIPATIAEKKAFLRERRIALWDVVESCRIEGSSDSSIRDVVPNDLARILEAAPIEAIFTNGATAHRLYRKYAEPQTGRPAILLPSTSPANAAFGRARLIVEWKERIQAAVRMW